jgi:hypothetical protein
VCVVTYWLVKLAPSSLFVSRDYNVGKFWPAISAEHYQVLACSGLRGGHSFSRVMQGGVAYTSSQKTGGTSNITYQN